MNREIKFRAWDGINKEMVYPQSLPDNLGISNLTSAQILSRFDEEHIMQFTGIKDKNGKEIYEGDVVKVVKIINGNFIDRITETFEVKWQLYTYTFQPIEGREYKQYTISPHCDCEIIGNIYENTELLNTTPNDNNP